MKIDGTNIQANQKLFTDLQRLQVGQRIRVEVLSLDQNTEGLINLGGNILKAKLEAQVKTGEQFMALVQEVNESGITLSREAVATAAQIHNLSKEQFLILQNRGFGLNQEAAKLLEAFKGSLALDAFALTLSQNPKLQGIIQLLKNIIPQWPDLSGQNYHPLQKFLSSLGLDYERMILDAIKKDGLIPIQDSPNLKALLLRVLAEEDLKSEDRESIQRLLDEITGQQLWAQSGSKRNSFFLFHFPLQDGAEPYYCVLAFEGARQGQKTDIHHSHIALQVDTPSLARIGADLKLFDDKLQLTILHEQPDIISPIIDLTQEGLKQNLARQGIQLEQVLVRTFEEFPQFSRFISGDYIGVDVKG